MRIELADTTNTLLREIAAPETKRKDVAQTYALALRSSHTTDWKSVNEAIIKRWSISGLQYIKKLAWNGKAFAAQEPSDV